MSAFQKVKNFLFGLKGTRDHTDDSVMTQFDLIDSKKIKNLHNIDQVAKENGKSEIPNSKANPPDSVEDKVLTTIKTIEADEGNKFTSRNEAYRRSMTALASDLDMEKLEQHRISKTANAENIAAIGINDLYTLKNKFMAADNNLKIFKKENNLENRAVSNEQNRILTFGILAVVFLGETAVNASFFSIAGGEAWLNSGMIALVLSGLNIALPFFYGYKILPFINSVNTNQHRLGFFSIFIAFAVIISINYLAANLREVLDDPTILSLTSAATQAMTQFTFSFSSVFSWFFMVFGLSLACFAMNKGYNFDDPYPGYGKLSRATEKLQESIQDVYADLVEELSEAIEEFDVYFHAVLDSIATRREKFTNINNSLVNLHQKFTASQSQYSTVYSSVISDYRKINSANRKTPPPKFFNQPVKYDHSFKIIKQVDLKFVKTVENTLKEAKITLPILIKQVKKDRDRLRNSIPSLAKLTKLTE